MQDAWLPLAVAKHWLKEVKPQFCVLEVMPPY
jgi:hypothetical protein